ncbi:MAG: M23 family metallopeptidase [Minisyncoccia bacterium]
MKYLVYGAIFLLIITVIFFYFLNFNNSNIKPTNIKQTANLVDNATITNNQSSTHSNPTSTIANKITNQVIILPTTSIKQGDILRIIIKNPDNNITNIQFLNNTYNFFKYNNELNAIIPINVNAKLGTYNLYINNINFVQPINIISANFPIIQIQLPQLITSPELLQKYQQEKQNIEKAYALSNPNIYFNTSFTYPLQNIEITSIFGEKRTDQSINYSSYHNGVDLRAKINTPVYAINNGVVKIADHYILEGNFIIIDHGSNIFSDYLHLNKLNVKQGDYVQKGQLIGWTGESGQTIGPHLHFMIKINNTPVDPLNFINLWKLD